MTSTVRNWQRKRFARASTLRLSRLVLWLVATSLSMASSSILLSVLAAKNWMNDWANNFSAGRLILGATRQRFPWRSLRPIATPNINSLSWLLLYMLHNWPLDTGFRLSDQRLGCASWSRLWYNWPLCAVGCGWDPARSRSLSAWGDVSWGRNSIRDRSSSTRLHMSRTRKPGMLRLAA